MQKTFAKLILIASIAIIIMSIPHAAFAQTKHLIRHRRFTAVSLVKHQVTHPLPPSPAPSSTPAPTPAATFRLADQLQERFAKYTTRMQSWVDKATASIEKMKKNGKNTMEAENLLKVTQDDLLNAQKLGNDAVDKLRSTISSENTLHITRSQAKLAIKLAQEAFTQVTRDFRTTTAAMRSVR